MGKPSSNDPPQSPPQSSPQSSQSSQQQQQNQGTEEFGNAVATQNNKMIVGAPYTAVRGKGEYVILKFGAVFIYYKQNVIEEVDLQEEKEEKEEKEDLQNLQDDISKGNDSPPPLIPNNSENNSNSNSEHNSSKNNNNNNNSENSKHEKEWIAKCTIVPSYKEDIDYRFGISVTISNNNVLVIGTAGKL